MKQINEIKWFLITIGFSVFFLGAYVLSTIYSLTVMSYIFLGLHGITYAPSPLIFFINTWRERND